MLHLGFLQGLCRIWAWSVVMSELPVCWCRLPHEPELGHVCAKGRDGAVDLVMVSLLHSMPWLMQVHWNCLVPV